MWFAVEQTERNSSGDVLLESTYFLEFKDEFHAKAQTRVGKILDFVPIRLGLLPQSKEFCSSCGHPKSGYYCMRCD
jgi:hypothetical protein